MAKVYTMGELERARKKAQIREWVQDKKDKATNWCYAYKNEILTYGPVVVSGIAAGAKMLSKHTAQAKEQDLKDLYVYSHRTGHYIKLRRKLKTSEWAEFDRTQTRKIQPPLWKEMNKFRMYFTMLKNVIKGFEEMMNCVLTAMNESLSDPYAGWNEGEELLMLNEVRCGIR